jgi:uncharacterized protein YacL
MRTRVQVLRFVEDVAAQAVGTVIGGAVAYLGAVALGMLPMVDTRNISVILLVTVVPLVVALVVLRERRASRAHRRMHRQLDHRTHEEAHRLGLPHEHHHVPLHPSPTQEVVVP